MEPGDLSPVSTVKGRNLMPPVNPGRILAIAWVLVSLGVLVLLLRSSAAAAARKAFRA